MNKLMKQKNLYRKFKETYNVITRRVVVVVVVVGAIIKSHIWYVRRDDLRSKNILLKRARSYKLQKLRVISEETLLIYGHTHTRMMIWGQQIYTPLIFILSAAKSSFGKRTAANNLILLIQMFSLLRRRRRRQWQQAGIRLQ